jgi:hypothetical protein
MPDRELLRKGRQEAMFVDDGRLNELYTIVPTDALSSRCGFSHQVRIRSASQTPAPEATVSHPVEATDPSLASGKLPLFHGTEQLQ